MRPQKDTAEELQSLLPYLENEYYNRIQAYCDGVDMHIAELHGGDVHQAASLYTSLGKKLTGQVQQYVRRIRFGLLPYIKELLEKEDSGHDCRSCASACTIGHAAEISEIKDAHHRIRETLSLLQAVEMPVPHVSAHANIYRSLHNEIALLNTTLKELFYLEESSLVPKMLETQKAIHVQH